MIPFSVLDLAPINLGSNATEAFKNSLDLARHVEAWNYKRFWLAEHHNMAGVGSAATSVLIAHIAAGTKTIRVGAGGVMLPNHAPLVIAEQFGTLAALHPGRIDLGLGRAPGTDMKTMRALRRSQDQGVDTFPQDVLELQGYFEDAPAEAILARGIQAVPGTGLHVPLWLLGSSLYSAQLAALFGLPFAFASHFAPDHMMEAIELYRSRFQPSAALEKPYLILALNAFVGDTDEEGRMLFSSLEQQFIALRKGTPGQLPPPKANALDEFERSMLERMLSCVAVGSKETAKAAIARFLERTKPDELLITSQIFDHQARLKSFEYVAQIRDELNF